MTLVLANLIWPALFLEQRMMSLWVIGAGLVIEYFVVLKLTDLSPLRSLLADVAMNAVSAVVGFGLLPVAGIVWELLPGRLIHTLLDVGTFNPVTWGATFLMAVAINAFVEGLVIRFGFKQQHLPRWRVFWILCAVNAVTVALAFGSLVASPPQV